MNFNKVARLRVQITERGLTLAAEPDKGDPDEEESLEAIERIAKELRRLRIFIKTFERNTDTGNRTDRISTFDTPKLDANSKIVGPDPDNDLDVLVFGGAVPSPVDKMSLYEATVQVSLMPQFESLIAKAGFNTRELKLVFPADSDLDAARKVARILKERTTEVIFFNRTAPVQTSLIFSVIQCVKLVYVVRDLYLRPVEDLLEYSRQSDSKAQQIMLLSH